jgi:hypothetical protein
MNCTILYSLFGVAVAACGEPSRATNSETTVTQVAQALTSSVNLIGSGNCTLRSGLIVNCQIPTQVLTGQDLDTAVPLRTVLTTKKTGHCSTQYPLAVTLETPGEPAVTYSFLSQATATVRRRDGAQIPFVTLKDASPWTKAAAFDASCEITASIVSNEPDVDTKDQAQAIIDRLTKDLADKVRIRDRYADLTSYQGAFEFLRRYVAFFHEELTSDALQKLRDDGQAARPVIMKMVLADACSGAVNDDELKGIVSLYASLTALGSSSSWKSADGGTQTIADFLGADGDKAVTVARKLQEQHKPDGGAGYEAEYQQAAQDAEQAKARLTLGKAQLSGWL